MIPVNCPYCNRSAELVTGQTIYPNRPDLHHRRFWLCRPCDAYVGCHPPGAVRKHEWEPMGTLADAETRIWRRRAHQAFDPLWRHGAKRLRSKRRRRAYHWLAHQLGMRFSECHIGRFDIATCMQVVDLCRRRQEVDNESARPPPNEQR